MNVVMTVAGRLRRGAGHRRGRCRSRRSELDSLLELAEAGITEIIELQREMVSRAAAPRPTAACGLVLRHRQPPQGGGDRGHPRPGHRRRGPATPSVEETGDDVRGERLHQGAAPCRRDRRGWRSPTTPASRSTTSAARRAIHSAARGPSEGDWIPRVLPRARRRRRRGAHVPLRLRGRGGLARRPGGRRARRGRGHDRRRAPRRGRLRLRPDRASQSRATAARSPR